MKKRAARVVSRRLFDISKLMLHTPGKLSENKARAEYYRKRAARMGACANEIYSEVCPECNIRYIKSVALCRDRLCPICAWRRGKALAARLRKVVSYNSGARYVLLTLTVKNCPWNTLDATLRQLLTAWGKLSRRVKFARAVQGWTRTLEITRGKDGLAHPHLHVLLSVSKDYFSVESGLWLEHDELVKMWRKCLNVVYSPAVDIRAVKCGQMGKAIEEVTKYLAKNVQIEGLSDEDFLSYAEAVAGVRAWGAGGIMRELDKEIEAEELLHTEDAEEDETNKHHCPLCGGELVSVVEKWDNINNVYDTSINWSRGGGITIYNKGVVNIVQTTEGARDAGETS